MAKNAQQTEEARKASEAQNQIEKSKVTSEDEQQSSDKTVTSPKWLRQLFHAGRSWSPVKETTPVASVGQQIDSEESPPSYPDVSNLVIEKKESLADEKI